VKRKSTLADKFDQKLFDAIYSRSLVYNTCWEDPAVDLQALDLTTSDRLLVITSAGCNALDYALAAPAQIFAVDANPRQTALLELKLAAIRRLEFGDFFAVFGHGHHPRFVELYHDALACELSPFARAWWSSHAHWFCRPDPRDTFYFHGLSGFVARAFRAYFRLRPTLKSAVDALFDTRDLEEQRAIYDARIASSLWTPGLNWTLSRQITLSMLGVPHPQRKEVQAQHAHGVAGFVREAIEYVFRSLPVWNNYFWAVYLRGHYTRECCPAYLKPHNFAALKAGLAERIEPHTRTVTDFLHSGGAAISRFVLLDHMDWMSSYHPEALVEEWHGILARATRDARVIFRSAHQAPAYLRAVRVDTARGPRPLTEVLRLHPERARELTRSDRVHTYAGFHIADIAA
jgi:S-adenosylmethionine-diacylglycerol 3-amino-3-carboxypropyl transferase